MAPRIALVLPLLLLAPMARADDETAHAPTLAIESYRLPNGLKVVLHRDTTVPRVTVCVAYHVGSKNERAGRTGFAHFFEHMMFRGTKHVPNYDIPLQETGAQSNAFTSEDMTVYFETVPSNFLERALYLEADRLAFLPSALDQSKFDTEREVVKNERRQSYENVPYGLAEETLLANVFPKGHPYSWSVIGSMKDLNHATLDDLKQFFAEFYHPANATLCLAGDFDPAEARSLIEKYFGPLVAGPEPKKVEAPESPPVSRKIVQTDDVQLPRVYWAWPSVADDHPDSPALDLLASILAGGEASRLHKALVLDRQIAKDVDATNETKEIAGLFRIEATAAEGKDPTESEKVIAEEIERLRNEPPTAAELERYLATYEKGTYTRLTSPLGRAITLSMGFAQKNDPAYYKTEIERYFQVKPEDIRRVARHYLTPEKVVLLIEPGKDESTAVEAGPNPEPNESRPPLAERAPRGGPDWSILPGPSKPRPFQPPKFVRRTLSNGMEVWIAPWTTLPIVTARLLIPAGTSDDPAGKTGLATLTARLLDKGTRTKTATELTEALETLGVTLGVGSGIDDTTIAFSSLKRNLDPALTLLGEVLTQPRFDPKDFERERQLQLTDLLQGPDNPGWIAQRVFRALLYGKSHPYGQPADGYVETVKAITMEDVRKFHKNRVAPKGSILIVVGDVEPDALMKSLESTLGQWKAEAAPRREIPPAQVETGPEVAYLVDKPGAVQSIVSVGRRWVERSDPRYFATLIGNRILGGDFLSRLNQNLREKNGFTYGAGSYFAFRRSGSVWAVRTAVRADATAPALREVLSELDALAGEKPFTAEEIGTAVSAETRSYPDTFDSPASIAGILEEMARFHLPLDYLDTFLDQLQATKKDQILEAMTQVVEPKARVILVVGDRESVEPKLKELGFQNIRLLTPDGDPAPRAKAD